MFEYHTSGWLVGLRFSHFIHMLFLFGIYFHAIYKISWDLINITKMPGKLVMKKIETETKETQSDAMKWERERVKKRCLKNNGIDKISIMLVRKTENFDIHTEMEPSNHVHNNAVSNVTPSSWSLYRFPETSTTQSCCTVFTLASSCYSL